MVQTHSLPLSVKRTAYVELRRALEIMSFATNEGNQSNEAFKNAVNTPNVLELIQTALSQQVVSFKKPYLSKEGIEKIPKVEVAAMTNSRSPKVIAATKFDLAEEFILRSQKTTSPSGINRGERWNSIDLQDKINQWRVHTVDHEFGSIVAFFQDDEPEDYVPPNDDVPDDCGFDPSEVCDPTDDSDDECEPIYSKCLSNFRPAC